MDDKHEVRELMRKPYADKNFPNEFPYRSKCIVVFQELDGVDVILFALYVNVGSWNLWIKRIYRIFGIHGIFGFFEEATVLHN